MKSGEKRTTAATRLGLGLWLGLLAGCAWERPQVEKAVLADRGAAQRNQALSQYYQVGAQDVLEIQVAGRPEIGGTKVVGPDGRIDIGPIGRLRVETRTAPQIQFYLADLIEAPPSQVQVRVSQFKSQQVYLFGEVAGFQRTVPYYGPETVLDLLHRVGGLASGAAPEKIDVVRARVAEGGQPEVYHIDLRDIVMEQNKSTNLRLQPFDAVYVGETPFASLKNCVPSFIRPIYNALFALHTDPPAPASPTSEKADALARAPSH
jgi:protein involved in polysaccharide export with SLBB domain